MRITRKYIITSLAAAAVATTAISAQQLPEQNYDSQALRYATPTAFYTMPDGAYFRGYDNELLNAVPTGPVEVVVPPYCSLQFIDCSSSIPSALTAQWSINNSEAYPEGSEDYGLPSGEATIVEAGADGSYTYVIGEEGLYRYPILTYGRYDYDLSEENEAIGLDGHYYTLAGIRATNDDVAITMHSVGGDNYYNRFVSFLFGGSDLVTVYPLASTAIEAAERSVVGMLCDGNQATYFAPADVPAAGDVIIIDCGEEAARGNITVAFADAEHLLIGTASILVGNTSTVADMTEVGTYNSAELAEGATSLTVDAQGVTARYIALQVTAVEEDNEVVPHYAEIAEENMRQFTGPVYQINSDTFPKASASHSAYGGNEVTRILDDDSGTYYWGGGSQNVGVYVMVDYGEVKARNSIKLVLTSNDYPRRFVIEISTDGSQWTQVGEEQDFTSAAPSDNTLLFDAAGAEARYVRMRITGAVSNWLQVADLIVDDITEQYAVTDSIELMSQNPVVPKVLTHYPRPIDPFVLDRLTMYVTTTPASPAVLVMPATEQMNVAITEWNAAEQTDGEVMAQTAVTLADMRAVAQYGGKTVYAIDVQFPQSVVLDRDFTVSAYDLDQITGLDISFMFGYISTERTGDYGRAMYATADGTEAHMGDYAYMWQLHGRYATLRPIEAGAALVAEPKGGTVVTDFMYSSANIADVAAVADEWLHLEFITNQLGRIAAYSITADANDTGQDREGTIVLTGADGGSFTFTVTQGRDEEATGIKQISAREVSVSRVGDSFVVTYPDGIDHIAVYSATGAQVAQCKLPAAGSMTLPAGNLASGLYIVRLTGPAGTVAVKVVK